MQIRALIVDDNETDRATYRRFLEPNLASFVAEAEDAREAERTLARDEFDCMLVDYQLPDVTGLELIESLPPHIQGSGMAVVFLTGYGSEEVAVQAIQKGAQDYLSKHRVTPEALGRSIENAVQKKRLMSELERRRRALEAAQLEQIALRNQFMSHISHELKTPLTAIHQLVQAVLESGPDQLSDESRAYLSIVFRNAEQLKRLIGDLVEATRAEAGKLRVDPKVIDVSELIHGVVRAFEVRAASRRVAVRCEVDSELPRILADPSRVQQILDNLLDNALKFAPEESTISIRAAADPHDEDMLGVSVADQGPGLRPDALERIFDRLQQENSGLSDDRCGLGLGLYICRELVARLGGRIWAESEAGEGSRFYFTLPICSTHSILGRVRRGTDPHFTLFSVDHVPRSRPTTETEESASAVATTRVRGSGRSWRHWACLRIESLGSIRGRPSVVLAIPLPDQERLLMVVSAAPSEAVRIRDEILQTISADPALSSAVDTEVTAWTYVIAHDLDDVGTKLERDAFDRRFHALLERAPVKEGTESL